MSAPASSKGIDLINRLDEDRKRGLGLLLVDVAAQRVQLPLAGVDISAKIADRVAQVTVKETFRNPHTEHLEAVYIFPLAPAAAISSFEMRVKDRVIQGKVQERSQARAEYQQAVTEGKRAALLEQERDDVFTVQVGNLPPGEEITVVITYSEKLPFFENGTTEVRLPLVVAPRYIPGVEVDRDSVGVGTSLDTDQVPDASRITPPRLAEGFDPKVALNIEVELLPSDDASGLSISDLACSQHVVKTSLSSSGVKISLAREDELLNRDFVLRWTLCQKGVKTNLISFIDESDSGLRYGMLSILPPRREGFLGVPRDVIFVVDRSGSMGGIKMTSAARACSILLNSLGPRDRYAIVAFDSVNEWMQPTGQPQGQYFVNADEDGVEQGEKFLRGIDARGGTEIYSALEQSLDLVARTRNDADERIPVIAVLTDGEIGNESMVLKNIQQTIGDCRIFTVGIDTAVNAGFLTRLASIGGGTCSFVQPGSQLESALSTVAREIGAPLVTDLEFIDDGCGIDGDSIAPSRIPDLFAGRASTCFFKFKPGKKAQLKIKGKMSGGGKFEVTVKPQTMSLNAIAQLWAKQHIIDLEDRFRAPSHGHVSLNPFDWNKKKAASPDAIKAQIIEIAVKHSLLTKFTAFVVVDHSEIVNSSGKTKQVVQPVQNPEAWDMCKENALPKMKAMTKSSLMGQLVRQRVDSEGANGNSLYDGPITLAESVRRKVCESREEIAADKRGLPPAEGDAGFDANQAPMSWGAPAGATPPPPPGQPARRPSPPTSPRLMGAGGIGGASQPIPTGKGRADRSQSEDRDAAPEQLNQAQSAFEKFAEAIETAWKSIENGSIPSVGPLEQARRELMQALSKLSVGEKVPLLQKFLRTEAVEFIAAVKKASSSQSLDAMVQTHKREFLSACAEATCHLKAGATSAKPFWDSSI